MIDKTKLKGSGIFVSCLILSTNMDLISTMVVEGYRDNPPVVLFLCGKENILLCHIHYLNKHYGKNSSNLPRV